MATHEIAKKKKKVLCSSPFFFFSLLRASKKEKTNHATKHTLSLHPHTHTHTYTFTSTPTYTHTKGGDRVLPVYKARAKKRAFAKRHVWRVDKCVQWDTPSWFFFFRPRAWEWGAHRGDSASHTNIFFGVCVCGRNGLATKQTISNRTLSSCRGRRRK